MKPKTKTVTPSTLAKAAAAGTRYASGHLDQMDAWSDYSQDHVSDELTPKDTCKVADAFLKALKAARK